MERKNFFRHGMKKLGGGEARTPTIIYTIPLLHHCHRAHTVADMNGLYPKFLLLFVNVCMFAMQSYDGVPASCASSRYTLCALHTDVL